MASEDEGSPKSYRDQCRSRFKPVSSSVSRRPKELIDKKRLQHPESFPLPKKSIAKQAFTNPEALRGRTLDSRQLKDIGVSRSHRSPLQDETLFSTKNLNRGKTLRGKSNERAGVGVGTGAALKYYPEKFMMEVFKVHNKEDPTMPVSGASSIDSAMPNFILCCASESSFEEKGKRTRGGTGSARRNELQTAAHSATCSSPQKSKNTSMEETNQSRRQQSKGSRTRSNSAYSSRELPASREKKSNQWNDFSRESIENVSCRCTCTCNTERLDNYYGQQERTHSTCGSLDSWSDPQISEFGSEMNQPTTNQRKPRNDKSQSEGVELTEDGTVALPTSQHEGNDIEETSSDCENSSDETIETDDCPPDDTAQNDAALSCYGPNNTHNSTAVCACCCDQEAIQNNQDREREREIMRMNSEYNEWLQVQNANALYPYPFCCPEGGMSYFGCCCPGTVMPTQATSLHAPTDISAMQPIQSSTQTYHPSSMPAFPTSDRQESRDQPTVADKSKLPQAAASSKSGGEKSLSSTRMKQNSQDSTQSKKTRREADFPAESANNREQPTTTPSRTFNTNLDDNANNNQSNNNHNSNPDQNQPQPWATSNNFGCYTPTPFFGCNVCPPYQGPWCFPWWYPAMPFGFEQCYDPMSISSSNNLQASHAQSSPYQARPGQYQQSKK